MGFNSGFKGLNHLRPALWNKLWTHRNIFRTLTFFITLLLT